MSKLIQVLLPWKWKLPSSAKKPQQNSIAGTVRKILETTHYIPENLTSWELLLWAHGAFLQDLRDHNLIFADNTEPFHEFLIYPSYAEEIEHSLGNRDGRLVVTFGAADELTLCRKSNNIGINLTTLALQKRYRLKNIIASEVWRHRETAYGDI